MDGKDTHFWPKRFRGGTKNPDYLEDSRDKTVCYEYDYSVICPSTGMMLTKDLPSLFFWNSTMPSHRAYNV